MSVTVTYNLKKEDSQKPKDYFSEYDRLTTIKAIASALESKGHRVSLLDVEGAVLICCFRGYPADMVFIFAEGRDSQFRV